MTRPRRLFIALPLILVPALLGLAIFAYSLMTRSFPETSGMIRLKTLRRPVEVLRDGYGVPHIRAEDEHDLFVAAGYVQAQDRLYQMEMTRRAGEGRLAEVLGPEAVNFDRLFRTVGISRLTRKLAAQISPESRAALEAYADGVNEFITSHHGRLPVEFALLGYSPEPWTVEHSLIVARLTAWELNLSWWVDITLGELVAQVGEERAREVFPTYPENGPVIVPKEWRTSASILEGGAHTPLTAGLPREALDQLRGFLRADREFRRAFQFEGMHAGSNCWAVDGARSASGKPILANDPHLAFGVPSKWYEMHLSCPGMNVAGVTIPGSPAIVIGHNDRIAWGVTNVMADDADFYIERVDSTDPLRYQFAGVWGVMDTVTEFINVKDNPPVLILIRSTHHGPVVNDVWPGIFHPVASPREDVVSMRWTGFEMSDEFGALERINRAGTWEEFSAGVKEFTVPGQNFTYADVDGNIGYRMGVRLPIRSGTQNPSLPCPGWTGEYEWRGFVPFDELPFMYNPAEHFIATANNKTIGDWYPYHISNLWEPPSRITRIRELLGREGKLSVDDFRRMQSDVVSPFAREMLPSIIAACSTDEARDPSVSRALIYFRNWDGGFTSESVPASIFSVFFTHLLHNTLGSHMDRQLFDTYITLSNIPYRVVPSLMRDSTSWWFDDPQTPVAETRDDAIRKSLSDALRDLEGRFGPEMKTYQWGELHTLTFEHPFGRRWPLDAIFNIGPFSTGGTGTTVNCGEYQLFGPYKDILGPSMRQVTDMSNVSRSWSVITTGQSGQPFTRHFSDQTPLWRHNSYHEMITDWQALEQAGGDLLRLIPEESRE